MKDIFQAGIPATIFIKDGAVLDEDPGKEVRDRTFDEKRLANIFYDNSPPVDENGNELKFKSKKRTLNSKDYRQLSENRKKNNT